MTSPPLEKREAAPRQGKAATQETDNGKTDSTPEPNSQGTTRALISCFSRVTDKEPTGAISIRDFCAEVREGKHRATVERVRVAIAAGNEGEAAEMKRRLPAVTLSGCITGRRAKASEEGRFTHSGWLQADFDELDGRGPAEVRDTLVKDPHVQCAFVSPSGAGVKALVRVPVCEDTASHARAWRAAEAYFRASYGLDLDPATKDPCRLCYASSDPAAAWNVAPVIPLEPAPVEPERPKAPAAPAPVIRSKAFPEPPHNGIHHWLPAAARWCESNGMSEAEAIAKLRSYEGRLRRNYSHNEPEDACRLVYSTPPPAGKPQAAPVFLYDGTRYYLDTGREFVPMDCRSVSRHMKARGMDGQEMETELCRIQTEGFIHFAGPLAGLPRGLHEMGGHKLLATAGPVIIPPRAGEWPTIRAVIRGLLGDDEAGDVQAQVFLAWLKFARESLVTGRRRPGQALALAGPRNCGKSLLIDILEAALGGRRANPYPYFTGRTNFNADIAGAELLAVDDEAGSTDIRARKALAASIKSNLFSGAVRIEGKHKTGFSFRPVWRMVFALNDEPEALLVLPPVAEDIGDKLTLLRCRKRPLPMPAHTLDEREAFFARLLAELPALLEWLERWPVPEQLREERCGVTHFHHPALLAALLELSPEGQLAGLIDTAERAGGIALPWEGTAAELKALLFACPTTAREAERLLAHWQPACGAFLGRLEGERTEKLTIVRGSQRWRILPGGGVVY